MDSHLIVALRSGKFRLGKTDWGPVLPDQLPTLEQVMLPTFPRIGPDGPHNTFSFEPIQLSDPAVEAIYRLPSNQLPPNLRVVQEFLRRAQSTVTGRPDLIISFKKGYTSCGRNPNFVACEVDGRVVELNGREYSFSVGHTGGPTLGDGPLGVHLLPILVHELGHWLGIGVEQHLTAPDNIMSATTRAARCIDKAVVEAVKTAAVNGPGGKGNLAAIRYE
jgi:hypothetical protein